MEGVLPQEAQAPRELLEFSMKTFPKCEVTCSVWTAPTLKLASRYLCVFCAHLQARFRLCGCEERVLDCETENLNLS